MPHAHTRMHTRARTHDAAEPPLYWPERRYPWGTAEAFNKSHSDLLSLRWGGGPTSTALRPHKH
jgi:hypothetical protein